MRWLDREQLTEVGGLEVCYMLSDIQQIRYPYKLCEPPRNTDYFVGNLFCLASENTATEHLFLLGLPIETQADTLDVDPITA